MINGKRYFFDTNAIVALLKGHTEILALANAADFMAISVISRLEFFALLIGVILNESGQPFSPQPREDQQLHQD
ncbi:MAG: hypothetical protein IE928_11215 [Gammaproteobacteria bacterium]|nr:hypothetical protein [Gammaproteobacteria bacterium]